MRTDIELADPRRARLGRRDTVQMTLCVFLARQRSGTGALGSIIDKHPQMSYLSEVFHHDAIDVAPNYFWFLRQRLAEDRTLALPNESPRRFELYADYLESLTKHRHKVIDIKYSSMHHFNPHWMSIAGTPGLFAILRKRATPILHLTRRNYLKAFVSARLAEANDIWHARDVSEISIQQLRVEPQACISFMNQAKQEDSRVLQILRKHPRFLTLDYAELFDESGELRHDVADRIAVFFDVEPFASTRPDYIKQVPMDLRGVLENFDEVVDALRPTAYAWTTDGD